MSLNDYAKECHTIACSKGWWDKEREVPEILCLIHSEVSEALEAYRNHNEENFREELADILIRVFDFAHRVGIDLDYEVEKKMTFNKHRPYRHGGKAV